MLDQFFFYTFVQFKFYLMLTFRHNSTIMTNQNMKDHIACWWCLTNSRQSLIFDPLWASQNILAKKNLDSNGGVYLNSQYWFFFTIVPLILFKFVRSFFGGNVGLKKSFRLFLIFSKDALQHLGPPFKSDFSNGFEPNVAYISNQR